MLDEGLGVFKNKRGSQEERIKKDLKKNLRENDLNIVIKCSLKIVDHLDVTLNLASSISLDLSTKSTHTYRISSNKPLRRSLNFETVRCSSY